MANFTNIFNYNTSIAGQLQNLSISSLVVAILIFLIFLILAKTITLLLKKSSLINEHAKLVISKIIYMLFFILGVLLISHELGLHVAIVASLITIIGFAIGIAGQSTISNLISGICVLAEANPKINDYIQVQDKTGYIQYIGFFSTTIKTDENYLVRLPNSLLQSTIFSNLSGLEYAEYKFTYINKPIDITILKHEIDKLNNNKNIRDLLQYDARYETKYKTNDLEIGNIIFPIKKGFLHQFKGQKTSIIQNAQLGFVDTDDWKLVLQIELWKKLSCFDQNSLL